MAREDAPKDTARDTTCGDVTRGGMARDLTRREAALLFGTVGTAAALAALSGCAGGSGSGEGAAPSGGDSPVDEASSASSVASSSSQSYWLYNPAGVKQGGTSVDSDLRHTMDSAGLDKPSRAAESSVRSEAYYPESDLYADVYRLFLERGWGDGLPMVPPIEQK